MKPKDGFVLEGPYSCKGSFSMHVCSPLRIGKNWHTQKQEDDGDDDDDDDDGSSCGMVAVPSSLF